MATARRAPRSSAERSPAVQRSGDLRATIPGAPPRARAGETSTSIALLIALLVTSSGLHVILGDVTWWFQLALLSIVLLGSAALVRRLSRQRWLPPLVAALVLVATLTVSFVPGTAFLGVVPTAQSWQEFEGLSAAAAQSITRQSLPAVVVTPILFLLFLGVGIIAIVADSLAVALRSPAFAGIPILVLLGVPSIVSIDSTDPVTFVLAAFAYLYLLWVASPRRQTRLALSLAGVVVVGALLVPLALPPVVPSENQNGTGFSSGVNPILNLGENLRRDGERTVLDYSTESGKAEYLRLVSLDKFSGSAWAPNTFDLQNRNTPSAIGDPPGLSGAVATTEEVSYINVHDLTSPWLPLPYPTANVGGLEGNWYWDADGLAVKSQARTARDQNYRATSRTIEPTPAQLKSAGTTLPPNFGRFLELPGNMPRIIAATARSVAGGASSNYEKALLLQNFFREGDFRYSETAPVNQGYDGTGMKVIAAFLEAKAGYCIHFASAMAVMARTLGIPSRIAVGFLPGTRLPNEVDGRTAYSVSSRNLHSWPELYFEGVGWTRFEPTVSLGEVPAYADVTSADVPTPVNTDVAAPTPSATPTPSGSSTPVAQDPNTAFGGTGATTIGIASGGWLLLAGALALAALVVLIPALVRAAQRNARLRNLRGGAAPAIVAWREVLQTAEDLGNAVPDTATPREAAALIDKHPHSSDQAPGADGGGTDDGRTDGRRTDGGALDRLLAAVERESYADAAKTGTYDGAASDTEQILAELHSAAGRQRRLRATLLPRSVWAWLLRPFSRAG